MIAIIDYGVGNLYSLHSSLKYIGADSVVTADRKVIENADKIILPGVGAFGDAVNKLRENSMDEIVKNEAKKGKYLLGICLGMQLLFEKSYEFGEHEGLSLIKGEVVPFKGEIDSALKIPHMGWNSLKFNPDYINDPFLKYTKDGDYVYFVHSFYAKTEMKNILASSCYGTQVTAAVKNENVYGTQFHPEKSGNIGLNMLKAFNEL